MNIEYLNERINDYKNSIETVVEKKKLWKSEVKTLLRNTLNAIVEKYKIGWRVQELDWIGAKDAINIIFDSLPVELIEQTNELANYQFLQGGALVFSQSYNGNVVITILFPLNDQTSLEDSSMELGVYNPKDISEKLIVEKVDEFLKEIIKWEVPNQKNKLGY